jgi:pilus assembly protein FimV
MTGTDIKTNTVFGNTGGGVVNTGDNSLTTGFSRQGLGNIDTDEVDPIAEAEVYLAYGRDAQAEEILRDALQKDPQRHEIYLKLLEIQAHNGRQEAFATLAGELYTATRGQGDTWAKAAAMGRQMDPANPMYAEGAVQAEAPAVSPAKDAPAVAKAKPPVEETQVFTIPPALTPEPPKHEIANLDFNLDELTTRPGFEPEAPVEPARAEGMPKIDLMDWEPAAATPAKPEKQAPPEPFAPSHADALVETLERPAPPLIEIPHAAPPAPAAPSFDAKPVVSGLDLDKLDLSFDPQRGPAEDPTPSVLDGQWHDAATKLDLAKAYHEMGDAEGAREILQEVLHEGDADQKKEAQTLLDRLRAA